MLGGERRRRAEFPDASADVAAALVRVMVDARISAWCTLLTVSTER